MRFDALDAVAQTRKRVRSCAGHAPVLQEGFLPFQAFEKETRAGLFVHDMF
jgi:hypothetical protein